MSNAPFMSRPQSDPEPLLVDAPAAARMLSVSERLLWSWTQSGDIACVRIGRRVLYPVQGLREWVSAHSVGGPAAGIGTSQPHDLKHRPGEPPVTTPEAARRRSPGGAT